MKITILLLLGLTLTLGENVLTTKDPTNKNDLFVNELLENHLKDLKTGDAGEFKKVEVSLIERKVFSEGYIWKVTGRFQLGSQTFHCLVKLIQITWQKPEDLIKVEAECGDDENKKFYSTE